MPDARVYRKANQAREAEHAHGEDYDVGNGGATTAVRAGRRWVDLQIKGPSRSGLIENDFTFVHDKTSSWFAVRFNPATA